ncbi:SgcJ/EcaC family oxidoreductase [Nonomuraea sp. NBC_01738]|uniref:SgcJ/EcaC family oxidoreductase n=1 Tax=Nonomuraea sp. NBC_01738 TaxID=2976003 RepID=UPI002E0ED58B|nr:SgcJ/EcaC family oxidoreductase [Nonomuraea sp. NBC_01738]
MASSTDTAPIRELLDQTRAAWDSGDGAAYGRLFTDDATDVTFVGTIYHGGAEIGRAHQALFDSFLKDSRMHMEIDDIRFYGRDTAVVVTRGEVGRSTPKKLGKVAVYTVVRGADGVWRIASIQKTQRKPVMEAISFRFQPATRPAR